MAQEIYNEGRVVGLSAYEIFVKQAIANGVEDIPTEAQWLTAMMGCGASMVLRIQPSVAHVGVNDFIFPSTSILSAAGVIFASPFIGDCVWDEEGAGKWATKVTSYGGLISNTSSSYPTSSTVPSGTYDPDEYQNCVSEFLKITDGIVYTQGATWVDAASQPPEKDIDPNFSESSTVVRLYLSEVPRTEIRVLLTGFLNKSILQGLSSVASGEGGGSADPSVNDWVNGGMLGPEVIPWASKIIFTVPSSAYSLANSLVRTMPSDTALSEDTYDIDDIHIRNVNDGEVKANSIIDFNSITLTDYYDIHTFSEKLPTLSEDVITVTLGNAESTNTLVAWYPGMTAEQIEVEDAKNPKSNANFFPPALYAAQITQTGNNTLVPIDVAAPGTVKGFTDQDDAINYRALMPNNFSLYHNTTTNTFSFVTSPDPAEWSGTTKLTYTSEPKAELVVGTQTLGVVALTKPNGTYYNINSETINIDSTTKVTSPLGKVNWNLLCEALKQEITIDLLGSNFRTIGTEVNLNNTIGVNNTVNRIGATTVTVNPQSNPVNMTTTTTTGATSGTVYNVAKFGNNSTLRSGTQFIEFADGRRLYIGSNPGTYGIPVGSIGIGW